MQEQGFWPEWAQLLQRRGLREPTAILLEAAGPLLLILAQLAYLGQPFFEKTMPAGQWTALAHLLENSEESRRFAAFLRGEETFDQQ